MKAMEALDLTKNEYEYDLNLARLNIERNLKQTEFEKLTEQKPSITLLFSVWWFYSY